MFPFIVADYPDQFYRLFTSLCLHAGIIHLAITVAFQHVLMSDLERLIGPLRMAILYIGSGIAGNLTSAIFVPYKAEVRCNNHKHRTINVIIFVLYIADRSAAVAGWRSIITDDTARAVSLEELEETARSYDQITSYRVYIIRVGHTALAAELYRADSGPAVRHGAHNGVRAVRERDGGARQEEQGNDCPCAQTGRMKWLLWPNLACDLEVGQPC